MASGFRPVPATEKGLCLFATYLVTEGLELRTVTVYLSAVSFLHIAEGTDDLFIPSCPRLHYILQGVKLKEVETGNEKRERLPINPGILRKIKGIWLSNPDIVMLWAGFFWFPA